MLQTIPITLRVTKICSRDTLLVESILSPFLARTMKYIRENKKKHIIIICENQVSFNIDLKEYPFVKSSSISLSDTKCKSRKVNEIAPKTNSTFPATDTN
jgi:adenylosuccinate synthase